jgi:hypothetical protein
MANIEPMAVGQILDRSLRLTPKLFLKLSPWYAVLAALVSGMTLFSSRKEVYLVVPFFIGVIGLSFALFFIVILLSREHWFGRVEAGVSDITSEINVGMVFRSFGLFIWVLVAGLLWMLLFIIPGIVYYYNRILSYYILVLEDEGVRASLSKSKWLMTRGKWYHSSSPIMRITGILLVHMFVNIIFSVFSQGGGAALGMSGDFAGETVLVFVFVFISTFLSYLTGLFAGISMVGFYYDLCARYEGADLLSSIEQMDATP